MLRLTVNTKRAPVEVLREARRFFGEGGLGLTPSQAEAGVSFEGAGGYVTVRFEPNAAGETIVDLSTREHEWAVRRFAREIA
ncbi:MAG: hypothetical protein FJZ92_05225 [Chloroflexi bacterium]|nr:hypothetical protein [Chloroflexota bacterium]